MASLNRATLLGRVGKDPEIRALQTGKKVANFSVATSESWVDKASGEKKESTQWHNVVCWNEGLCGVIERFVKKGDQIYIEGAIETRKWTDQSGAEKYSTEIVIKAFGGNLVLLGGGKSGASDGQRSAPASDSKGSYQQAAPSNDLDDDIPF